ncbi:MAG: DUF2796 domain-containing protein [Pseudomonadota bacterium]
MTMMAGVSFSAIAGEKRELGSHEHGVGLLNIAFEDAQIAMELEAPGADIVGFEHEANTAEDRAKIDAAIATLAQPLTLFSFPASAGCSVVEAKAALIGEDAEDEHHHGHGDDHGDEAAHDDHDHDDHAHGEESHSEFRAEYVLSCADPSAIDKIDFAYFEQFPNALELEVQLISDKGSNGFEVERDAPSLSLGGAI